MTSVAKFNLLFSLPDVLMAEVFAFDTTYRIFGSDKFKKELQYGWLKKQACYAKEKVTNLIDDYIYDDDEFTFKNEYCCVGGPSDQFFKDNLYGKRKHVETTDEIMIYIAPPKNEVLYYKILPKEFINKPKDFFNNLRYDGFFCDTDQDLSNIYTLIEQSLYRKNCAPIDLDDWYVNLQGRNVAPFMYRTMNCWF